ncbi:hypothetical protein DIPPA_17632 [Diplonema papillatum]|nr:hypothetical protein DIPPA_17632 [Diplonema papillatum]
MRFEQCLFPSTLLCLLTALVLHAREGWQTALYEGPGDAQPLAPAGVAVVAGPEDLANVSRLHHSCVHRGGASVGTLFVCYHGDPAVFTHWHGVAAVRLRDVVPAEHRGQLDFPTPPDTSLHEMYWGDCVLHARTQLGWVAGRNPRNVTVLSLAPSVVVRSSRQINSFAAHTAVGYFMGRNRGDDMPCTLDAQGFLFWGESIFPRPYSVVAVWRQTRSRDASTYAPLLSRHVCTRMGVAGLFQYRQGSPGHRGGASAADVFRANFDEGEFAANGTAARGAVFGGVAGLPGCFVAYNRSSIAARTARLTRAVRDGVVDTPPTPPPPRRGPRGPPARAVFATALPPLPKPAGATPELCRFLAKRAEKHPCWPHQIAADFVKGVAELQLPYEAVVAVGVFMGSREDVVAWEAHKIALENSASSSSGSVSILIIPLRAYLLDSLSSWTANRVVDAARRAQPSAEFSCFLHPLSRPQRREPWRRLPSLLAGRAFVVPADPLAHAACVSHRQADADEFFLHPALPLQAAVASIAPVLRETEVAVGYPWGAEAGAFGSLSTFHTTSNFTTRIMSSFLPWARELRAAKLVQVTG